MKRRVDAGHGSRAPELMSIAAWCEARGSDGHITGEAWNDGTVAEWIAARTAAPWPDELEERWLELRTLPHAPFHSEFV